MLTPATVYSDAMNASAKAAARATAEAEVTDLAKRLILPGFTTHDDALDAVLEFAGALDPTLARDTIATLVDQVWWDRVADQCDWVDAGDYARFEAALYALGRIGYLVRENFSCCTTCGLRDIQAEPHAGRHAFVFFHQQDTEDLAARQPDLHLSFGHLAGHGVVGADTPGVEIDLAEQRADADTMIGAEVSAMLRRFDLAVDWDGLPDSRITVHLADWRRALPVDHPEA